MVVCRPKSENAEVSDRRVAYRGGPVFMPRRKPSALAEALMAELQRQEAERSESVEALQKAS